MNGMSHEAVLIRPFWRGSCAGARKLSLGQIWTKVVRNSVETAILEVFLCGGGTKLSLGRDDVPRCTKWTKVERNCIEPAILEEFLCRDHKAKLHRYTEWTRVVRNGIETTILEGFLCRGHKTNAR